MSRLPAGIGPHDGQELSLMLAGCKPCALFYDTKASPPNEDIIPENAFFPFVQAGQILRYDWIIGDIRYVGYALPEQIWRIDFLKWIKIRLHHGDSDITDDIIEGRILGYTEKDIQSYIHHRKTIRPLSGN